MDPRIAEVLADIRRRPQADIAALAASVHLSPSRLRHLFLKETQASLYAYVREQRLLWAEKLLTTGYLTVKEVSATVGFNDTCHFVREFRKRFALPPAVYRRLHTRSAAFGNK